jgi:hypothetical protein
MVETKTFYGVIFLEFSFCYSLLAVVSATGED